VLVKKAPELSWDRLTKKDPLLPEEQAPDLLEQAQREKSLSDREDRARKARRNPKESSPSPENDPRLSKAVRGHSESPKSNSEKSKGSLERKPQQRPARQPAARAADPYFEEISKDFKDLHKSKDKNNFLSSGPPKKPVATIKASESASDSELMDEMSSRP
jgi:hypothetical protein